MGAFTPLAKIWYPDQNDTAKIDTLMATLASSIENGLQPRLALQEKAVGLKASVPANTFTIPWASAPSGGYVIPYRVTSNNGDFNNGFTISTSGVVTVQTPGMYFASAQMGTAGAVTGHGVKTLLMKNSTEIGADERVMNDSTNWVDSTATAILNCVAGDTISAVGYLTGASFSSTLGNSGETTYISVVLIRPTPLVS